MRKLFIILIIAILFSTLLTGQEIQNLFKAKSFTEAFFNPAYQELKKRKENKMMLTDKEEKWLATYQQYLDNYFKLLNNKQQDQFHLDRSAIEFKKNDTSKTSSKLVIIADRKSEVKGDRDNELLLGHILFSGASGIVYGVQLNYIFNIERTATRIGLPMLISGGSMLGPIFLPQYENINTNSLWLRLHGKTMGGLYGYFLTGAIFGDDIFESYDYYYQGYFYNETRHRNKKPLAISTSLIGSVALGQLGFHFGKTKSWTDGRIATYQYYSYAMPTLACGLLLSFSENAKFQAYSSLIATGVPLGYLAGHQIANKFDFTRGDINAITNNTAIGAAFGGSLLAYIEPNDQKALLIPISTALIGSAIGHYTYRNLHITRPEARRLNYATVGGGLIGLGLTVMIDPDEEGTYFLIPSIFGTLGYATLLSYYKNQPRFSEKESTFKDFNFSLHPESLLINNQLPPHMQAPLFSMRFKL